MYGDEGDGNIYTGGNGFNGGSSNVAFLKLSNPVIIVMIVLIIILIIMLVIIHADNCTEHFMENDPPKVQYVETYMTRKTNQKRHLDPYTEQSKITKRIKNKLNNFWLFCIWIKMSFLIWHLDPYTEQSKITKRIKNKLNSREKYTVGNQEYDESILSPNYNALKRIIKPVSN